MTLFHPSNRHRNPRTARLYALYELAYTAVDFTAALLFVAGSVLFFNESTATLATWLFLIGSICFALRPTIHLAREIHYWSIGRVDKLTGQSEE